MNGALRMTKLDAFTMRPYFLTYLALMPVMLLFAYMRSSDTLLYFTCAWFVALTATNIFAVEEKNNLGRLYGTLSIRIKDIVLGRYLFVVLTYAMAVVLVLLFSSGIAIYQGQAVSWHNGVLGIGVSFLAFSIMVGSQLPLFFRFGYVKAKFLALIPFLLMMLIMVIPSLTDKMSGLTDYAQVHPFNVGWRSLLAGIFILGVSYRSAVSFYQKRR